MPMRCSRAWANFFFLATFTSCKTPIEMHETSTNAHRAHAPSASASTSALEQVPPPTNLVGEASTKPEIRSADAPTSASIRPPDRRCIAYEKRDRPAGALAWISECFIKTASPIHFQFNSDVIHIESEATLQAVANVLHDERTLRIEIGSHTDGRGSYQYNLELSQKRAEAIKQHLVGKGIDAERLVARGFGEDRPISHPPVVQGRRTNRRIDFVILPE